MWMMMIWGLLGCGGQEPSAGPPADLRRPLTELEGGAPVVVAVPSNGHGGLSNSGVRVQSLRLWSGGEGQLFAAWREPDALRVRAWSGESWTDQRYSLRLSSSERLRPADLVPTSTGIALIGGGHDDLPELPSIDLRIVGDGEPRVVQAPPAWKSAIDPLGRTVVFHFAGPSVMVHRFEDGAWNTLGGPAEARGFSGAGRMGPSLTFDESANPIVAWRQPYTVMPDKGDKYKRKRWRTWVRQWTGSEWAWLAAERSPLDEKPPVMDDSKFEDAELRRNAWEAAQDRAPALAFVDGAAVVAWPTLSGLETWRYRDSAWAKIASPVDLPGTVGDLAMLRLGGKLNVAWSHGWRSKGSRLPREIQLRQWTPDGWIDPASTGPVGLSATPGPSNEPVLGAWGEGPVVAWTDTTSGVPDVYVARLEDQAWVGMPEGSVTGGLGDGLNPVSDLAVWANGNEVRVARTIRGKQDILMASTLGTDGGWSNGPELAVKSGVLDAEFVADGAGRFWVAYEQRSPESGLFVFREGGTGWSPIGSREQGLVPDAVGRYPFALEVDPSGSPWVVWTHNGRAPQVRRHDGDRWVIPDRLTGSSQDTFPPKISFDGDGRAHVLWSASSSNRDQDLKIAVFDGVEWARIGTDWWLHCDGNLGGPAPLDADLAVDGTGSPVVAWVQRRPAKRKEKSGPSAYRIRSCRWDGKAWNMLSDIAESEDLHDRAPRRSSITLTSVEGQILAAWTEGADPYRQVFSRVLEGETWSPVGDGDGQVSTCESACFNAAIGAGARRCLVWEEMGQRAAVGAVACAEP